MNITSLCLTFYSSYSQSKVLTFFLLTVKCSMLMFSEKKKKKDK